MKTAAPRNQAGRPYSNPFTGRVLIIRTCLSLWWPCTNYKCGVNGNYISLRTLWHLEFHHLHKSTVWFMCDFQLRARITAPSELLTAQLNMAPDITSCSGRWVTTSSTGHVTHCTDTASVPEHDRWLAMLRYATIKSFCGLERTQERRLTTAFATVQLLSSFTLLFHHVSQVQPSLLHKPPCSQPHRMSTAIIASYLHRAANACHSAYVTAPKPQDFDTWQPKVASGEMRSSHLL